MIEQDIATRRARDLERYHRRTAERHAKGLCLKCGKRPPAPHRSQCEPCIEKRRSADLARHHRRTAERAAQGLCPKCGKQPPATGRTLCEACNEKRNRASRARDARLRAAGVPRRDRERARVYERERSHREADRRRAAGLCLHCGKAPALEGRSTCGPCAEARRARERALYASRRATGLCGTCGGPTTDGGSRCAPCAVAETARYPSKNAARRGEYARRKAEGRCTDCGEPSQGAARCEPCARRSWERSAYFHAMPVYDPQFTVVDLDTGDEHGPFDSWEDVALAMAFARLPPERVEVLTDAPAIAGIAARE